MHRDVLLSQNQREALISQIYFWNKTLHVSDSICVHQQFFTVHTAIGIGHTGYADCLLAGSRQQAVRITCMTYTYCCAYSARLLMMDRDTVRNM